MSSRRSGVSAVADARGVVPRLGPTASRAIGGAGRQGFDWTVAGLSAVFVGGLFLDGWAHTHGRVDQSFFTPWHAVFYSGYAAVAAALVGAVLGRRARGHRWRHAAPAGYGLSLVGGLVFAAAGMGDLVWHLVFGIEAGAEALLSPTHLALGLGMGLVVSGPLRAAWQRPGGAPGWVAQGPAVLALASTLSALTFFTLYAHPIVAPAAGAAHPYAGAESMGVTAILLQTGLLMGTVLLAVRHRPLPRGALTVIVTLNAGAMGFLSVHGGYPLALVVAAGVAGLGADLLYALLRPTAARPVAWRLFASAVPGAVYLGYFLALRLTEGLAWSVHVWTGSIALAGTAGWLLSYLLVPPRSAASDGV